MVMGGIVLLCLVAIAVIPFLVDVDKYRPQITEAVDQKMNGKLELGKLSLSLWGQVRVEIAGLSLVDAHATQVIAVKDAYFYLPFSSLLTGSPELTFKMDAPEIRVIKHKDGKLNVMSLMKEAPVSGAVQPGQPQTAPSAPGANSLALPGIVASARLGVELRNASVVFHDEGTGLDTKLDNLNLLLKDMSLSHPTQIQFWSDLNTTLGKSFALHGPVRLDGAIVPSVSGGKFDHATLTAKLNADDLEMAVPGVFEKKKGIATQLDIALTASPNEVKIDHLDAKFFNAEIKSVGTISNLAATGGGAANPAVQFHVKSNEIDFKPWVQLVPMMKDYDLGGTASLDAEVNGPSSKLAYQATAKVNGLTAKAPKLKAEPRIDALVHVITDQIDNLTLTMKAPGNDLEVHGKVVSFTAPKADFTVSSSGMDLDQLVEFPPPAASGAKTASNANTEGAAGEPKAADYDAMLDPMRHNKSLAAMSASIGLNLKMLKAHGVKMSDMTGRLFFKSLSAGIEGFAVKIWDGTVKMSATTELAPVHPTYHFTTGVAGLDLSQAVASQMAMFKNTVTGKTNLDMSGSGASFNPPAAIDNLNAKGNLKITNAEFTSIDVGKMASDALAKAVSSIGDKVPGLKGKSLGAPPSGGSKYELISSDFSISGGKFSAPNFVGKAAPNKGIDLKGNTVVGMKDYSLKADWQVIDTYNLLHARELSTGSVVPGGSGQPLLAAGNSPVTFPVSVGGTLMAPSYSYPAVAEALGKVALNNITGAATGQAKEQAKKVIQNLAPNAPAPVQNVLKGLFGG